MVGIVLYLLWSVAAGALSAIVFAWFWEVVLGRK